MMTAAALPLELLFEQDETAWLDAMAKLAADGRLSELDHHNLSEYLADMAKRDRREVFSRLVVLLAHLLKWNYQPEHRSKSWQATIREQRRELRQLVESGTLYHHAETVFLDAYGEAREQAAEETEQNIDVFPSSSPWSLADALDSDAIAK